MSLLLLPRGLRVLIELFRIFCACKYLRVFVYIYIYRSGWNLTWDTRIFESWANEIDFTLYRTSLLKLSNLLMFRLRVQLYTIKLFSPPTRKKKVKTSMNERFVGDPWKINFTNGASHRSINRTSNPEAPGTPEHSRTHLFPPFPSRYKFKWAQPLTAKLNYTEKEHQKQLERERKEQRKAERGELRTEQEQQQQQIKDDTTAVVVSSAPVEKKELVAASLVKEKKDHQQVQQVHEVQQHEQHEQQQPAAAASTAVKHSEGLIRAAHSMTHDVSHSEPVSLYDGFINNDCIIKCKRREPMKLLWWNGQSSCLSRNSRCLVRHIAVLIKCQYITLWLRMSSNSQVRGNFWANIEQTTSPHSPFLRLYLNILTVAVVDRFCSELFIGGFALIYFFALAGVIIHEQRVIFSFPVKYFAGSFCNTHLVYCERGDFSTVKSSYIRQGCIVDFLFFKFYIRCCCENSRCKIFCKIKSIADNTEAIRARDMKINLGIVDSLLLDSAIYFSRIAYVTPLYIFEKRTRRVSRAWDGLDRVRPVYTHKPSRAIPFVFLIYFTCQIQCFEHLYCSEKCRVLLVFHRNDFFFILGLLSSTIAKFRYHKFTLAQEINAIL